MIRKLPEKRLKFRIFIMETLASKKNILTIQINF